MRWMPWACRKPAVFTPHPPQQHDLVEFIGGRLSESPVRPPVSQDIDHPLQVAPSSKSPSGNSERPGSGVVQGRSATRFRCATGTLSPPRDPFDITRPAPSEFPDGLSADFPQIEGPLARLRERNSPGGRL